MKKLPLIAASLLAAAPLAAQVPANPAPSEIVAAAPKAEWTAIPASDLLVMDLAADAKGKARRVVIQLMPAPFSQGWIGNIRKLAGLHWWDGLSVNRVQDNYVVQWGDAEGDDKAKAKPLPGGLTKVPEADYAVRQGLLLNQVHGKDAYGARTGYFQGWPVAFTDRVWPVHCYGMVGVGRSNSPDTGTGAELYTVIGHAPRQLDRNIALVGRVIDGIDNLSSLPRGTATLGFYASAEERVPIVSIRPGSEVPELPAYEYLSTASASFARYVTARENRHDAFFIQPAGGADICNVPVPVRRRGV